MHAAPYLVVTTHWLPASCVPEEEGGGRPCQPEVLEATQQGTWHQARPHASLMVYVQIRRDFYQVEPRSCAAVHRAGHSWLPSSGTRLPPIGASLQHAFSSHKLPCMYPTDKAAIVHAGGQQLIDHCCTHQGRGSSRLRVEAREQGCRVDVENNMRRWGSLHVARCRLGRPPCAIFEEILEAGAPCMELIYHLTADM